MNKQDVTIYILGNPYQIKCAESELPSLQRAVSYLEEKMLSMRDKDDHLSLDRLAIITALNLANQFLNLKHDNQHQDLALQNRLQQLQKKVEKALFSQAEMELQAE